MSPQNRPPDTRVGQPEAPRRRRGSQYRRAVERGRLRAVQPLPPRGRPERERRMGSAVAPTCLSCGERSHHRLAGQALWRPRSPPLARRLTYPRQHRGNSRPANASRFPPGLPVPRPDEAYRAPRLDEGSSIDIARSWPGPERRGSAVTACGLRNDRIDLTVPCPRQPLSNLIAGGSVDRCSSVVDTIQGQIRP